MKPLFKIFLGIFLLTPTFLRGESECGTQKVIEHRKPMIHFEPFPMTNPQTGARYHPNDLIDVPDEKGHITKVKASEYFAKINSIEESLNQWGYSLRTEGSDNLSSLNYCAKRLEKQVALIDKYVRDEKAKYLKSDEEWLSKWATAWDEYQKDIPSWEDLYRYADDKSYDVYMPEVPVFSAKRPSFERKPIEFSKEKTYTLVKGSDGDFKVGIYPYYKIGASKLEAKGDAGVNVEGAILGKWKGNIANIAIKTHSPSTGPLKIDLVASVIDGRKTWSKPLVEEGALRYHDDVRVAVAKSVSYRFAVGPIPMKAEAGLRGEAGFGWGLELYPLQIGAYAGPWAATDAFAQVGADVAVAGISAGGQLRLAEYQLTLQGSGVFEYEDEPQINLNLALTSKLDLLSGDLYAYAYVYYPVPWPPWKEKKSWRHTLFEWDGYKKEGTLFDYRATYNRNGLVAEGDLSPEDVLEMNHTNRELYLEDLEEKTGAQVYETMRAINGDLASANHHNLPRSAQVIMQLAINLDEMINTYFVRLEGIGDES